MKIRKFTKLEKKMLNINAAKESALSNLFNYTKGQGKIHPQRWSMRSQGHHNLLGCGVLDIGEVLESMGLHRNDYVTGNDAPRGGISGDFLYLTTAGRAKIKRIMN